MKKNVFIYSCSTINDFKASKNFAYINTENLDSVSVYAYEKMLENATRLSISDINNNVIFCEHDDSSIYFYGVYLNFGNVAYYESDEIDYDFERLLRTAGFRKCDHCGKWISPSKLNSESVYIGNNTRYCNACYEELNKNKIKVYGYHGSSSYLKFFKCEDEEMTEENFKGYGIEMEADRTGSSMVRNGYIKATDEFYKNRKLFRCEHDGSLNNGVEFISNCFSSKFLKTIDWSILTNQMKALGAEDSISTSGFHIHASKLILGDNELKQVLNFLKIMYIMSAYEEDFLRMSGRKRNEMYYCSFYSKETIIETAKRIIDAAKEDRRNLFAYISSSHSHCLISSNKTIEFRIFKSTSDPIRIKHILSFISGLCENIDNVKWSKIYCMSKIFKGINEDTMRYFRNQGIFNRTIANVTKGEEIDLSGIDLAAAGIRA